MRRLLRKVFGRFLDFMPLLGCRHASATCDVAGALRAQHTVAKKVSVGTWEPCVEDTVDPRTTAKSPMDILAAGVCCCLGGFQ